MLLLPELGRFQLSLHCAEADIRDLAPGIRKFVLSFSSLGYILIYKRTLRGTELVYHSSMI